MRFVDSHMHLWHLTEHKWYPALDPPEDSDDFGIGDMAGLRRDYLPEHYLADAAGSGLDVVKAVHVSAVTAPGTHLDEARWLDRVAAEHGLVGAVIGAVEPGADAETVAADLAEQAKSPLFRGIRVLYGFDPADPVTRRLAELLDAGGHVFDVVIHPGEVDGWLSLLRDFPGLAVVLEHAGWPDGGDPDQFTAWRDGLTRLASLANVDCKISGLPMSLHTLDAETLRPWIQACLEVFGVDRSFFGSNFPVDSIFGGYDKVAEAYLGATGDLTAAERDRVFAANAERRYRI
ncbi:amidohydrolase family protein [Nonomuraea harbinensis]|uniref:Amidohydrolase family protein n=1 Tax=Nonomuraea harbinensis TaxID=1286938 RepID=A0ABW1BKS6_9ACTN|nr:amidohydrolase family protein [Nonomuraea harbinensis]